MPPLKNRVGETYGRLTVIERAENQGRRVAWLCRCECGNTCVVLGDSLQSGNTRSCGCLNDEGRKKVGKNNKIDLTGQKFGKLTVIKDTGRRRKTGANNKGSSIYWLCQCDCGNICEVEGSNLKTGNTMSCGCIGKSQGEFLIEKILKENNFVYVNNQTLPGKSPIYKAPLRFDFIIFTQNKEISYVIEYDGEQHFKGFSGSWGDAEDFQTLRDRDLTKNHYCFENNIPIIRIPYTIKDIKLTDILIETSPFLLTRKKEDAYYGI